MARTQVLTFNDAGEEKKTTWREVHEAAQRIQEFFRAVQAMFVERDELIKILKYAFLMREHVLIYGPPGTAKTAIADMIVQGIEGATGWRCDLSRFMSEASVFGDFDVKRARDTGQLVHRTDGSILEAHFANLGELLDCNTALLRSLLRVLNEREFLRGPQRLKVPLMTAVANTNVPPMEAVKRDPLLEAVLDRFLFWEPIEYVKDPGSRLRMLKGFLERRQSGKLPVVSINDIKLVSGVVLRMNLLSNEFILQAYEELARRFVELRGRPITDRRLNKAIQILQASAVLDGTTEVDWDDLDRVELVFMDHPEDRSHFQTALAEVKAKWQKEETQAQSSSEGLAIEGLAARIPTIDLAKATEAELVTAKRALLALKKEVEAFATTTPGGASKRGEVLTTVNIKLDEVQKRIDGAI